MIDQRAAEVEKLAEKDEVEAAVAELKKVNDEISAAQDRLKEREATREVYAAALEHRKNFEDGYQDERNRIVNLIRDAEKAVSRLQDSGCPTPEAATCKFLFDARQAADDLPKAREDLVALEAQHEELLAPFDSAVSGVEAKLEAIGNPAHDLTQLMLKQGRLQRTAAKASAIEAAERHIATLDADISKSEATIQDVREKIAAATAAREALEPVVDEAARLQSEITRLEPFVKVLEECRVAAATVSSLSPVIEQMRGEITTMEAKLEAIKTEAQEIRARVPEGSDIDLGFYQISLSNLRSKANRYASERGAIKAKLEQVAEAEEQTAKLRQTVSGLASMLDDYAALAQAFGLDGIQYMIIRGVVPEIMRQSNDILASMTGGRMAVDIRTEKELKSTKQMTNSLEVWISSIQGTVRPYLSHSGGEKVKIALAVTLGLADVKARRAGVQLGMLFIDEPPFLDADGTEAYADALSNMAGRNPSMRILAISHDPTMKARFSQNIIVSAGEDGSTVSMEL